MKRAETVTFGGSGLDRAAPVRADATRLSEARRTGTALPVWRGKPMVTTSGALAWLAADHPVFGGAGVEVFLGDDDGTPRFARVVPDWDDGPLADTLGGFHDPSEQAHPAVDGAVFAELRARMTTLTPREAELAATARALLDWHRTHAFCANCGAQSRPAQAGWQRDCDACGRHHFPRTDPVVIMLVTHGDRVLIGRSPGWPDGMYSLLAGFVEPGETMEAAVRREVFEETAVVVGEVSYLASQPWPFPASLMLGCHGHAVSTEIEVDPKEIEAARWVTRQHIHHVLPRAG